MPSSPIVKSGVVFPENWRELQKVIIPDSKTAHYWGVWFEEGDEAWLMCCYIDNNPSVIANWMNAEDLDETCEPTLNTIKAVYGVSFHESVWKEISPAQTLKDNPIV